MVIQWFPGHMTKTRRKIQETIKQVDVVIELLDARIPISSRNPDIDWLVEQKPRVIALNKSDLADEAINKQWEAWYKKQGITVIYTNALSGMGLKEIHKELRLLTKTKLESALRRGRLQRPIKTLVVGIPNVGKSAFINKIAGKAVAATGDKPGVTRAQQWVRIHPEIQLLDTPGILWPKFNDQETGLVLAYTGAIKDDIMDTTELASGLLARLAILYPKRIEDRYKLQDVSNKTGMELLIEAGKRRGCLISGGEVDLHRISAIVLDEFRGAKMGRMSLEKPPMNGEKHKKTEHSSSDISSKIKETSENVPERVDQVLETKDQTQGNVDNMSELEEQILELDEQTQKNVDNMSELEDQILELDEQTPGSLKNEP